MLFAYRDLAANVVVAGKRSRIGACNLLAEFGGSLFHDLLPKFPQSPLLRLVHVCWPLLSHATEYLAARDVAKCGQERYSGIASLGRSVQ